MLAMTHKSKNISDRRHRIAREHPEWNPRALHEHFDEMVKRYPDRPYLIGDGRELSYQECQSLSRGYAAGLRDLGVQSGSRVGLLLANYPELAILKLAISRLGAISVGFNFELRSEELKYVLNHSGCNTLVTMTRHGNSDYLELLEEIQGDWLTGKRDQLPTLSQVVLFPTGGEIPEGVLTLSDLERRGKLLPDAEVSVDPFGPSDILYTSGTTGKPKAVVLSHDSLLRNSFATAYTRAFEDGWRIIFALPLYHVFAYAEGLLAATFVGGAIIPRLKFSGQDHLECIERFRANDILAVPTMTISLLEEPEIEKYDLSSLKGIFSAAAPCPEWVWKQAAEKLKVKEIVTGYGMTEMCGAIIMTLPEDPIEVLNQTVGRFKMAGPSATLESGDVCELRMFHSQTGDALEAGEIGEFAWKGDVMTIGYWNGEAVEPIGDEGFLPSGDLGYLRDDGYFVLTGRSKDVYKSGGELVEPTEIEQYISGIEGIAQCYVVGVPDDRWGEVGHAYVVPLPGRTIEPEQIIQKCKASLARFKVPKQVFVLSADELPKTATGKIQKFKMQGVWR